MKHLGLTILGIALILVATTAGQTAAGSLSVFAFVLAFIGGGILGHVAFVADRREK